MLKVIDNHVVNIAEIIAVKREYFNSEIYFKGGDKVELILSNVDYEVLLNHIQDYSLGQRGN